MPKQLLRFDQWANFHVITSAAAATLLGLLFVVITLVGERGRGDTPTSRIYLTPAVIYFTGVLLMSVPKQTRHTAVICICLEGIAGLGYSGSWQSSEVVINNAPTFFPMSSFRWQHMPSWSPVACCCFAGSETQGR